MKKAEMLEQVRAEVAKELAMLEGALGLALRDRDRDRARIAELEAYSADIEQSAIHWHDVGEHYRGLLVKMASSLRALTGLDSAGLATIVTVAETELQNATPAWTDPDGRRPTVKDLADHSGFTDPPLTESSVPARRKQPAQRYPGRYPGPGASHWPGR